MGVLEEAIRTVRNREPIYGHPADNFEDVALLWTAWLKAKYNSDLELDLQDVGQMNLLQKVARTITAPEHEDNYVDAAGYADATSRALGLQ